MLYLAKIALLVFGGVMVTAWLAIPLWLRQLIAVLGPPAYGMLEDYVESTPGKADDEYLEAIYAKVAERFGLEKPDA